MSDVLIVSCRLCLEPDELTSMVTIARQLGSPLRTVEFSICRPCARAIAGELQALDSDYTQEVSGDVEAGNQSNRKLDEGPAAAGNREPEVGVPSDASGNFVPDRPEPEVSAGGKDGERDPEKG